MVAALTTRKQATNADTIFLSVSRLKTLARRGLTRMYRPEEGLFAFTLRRDAEAHRLEGTSVRYTAIALLGLADEDESVQSEILHGDSAGNLCSQLVERTDRIENLGDVALILRAASAMGLANVQSARNRLNAFEPQVQPHPTVELAWTLAAMVAGEGEVGADRPAKNGADKRAVHAVAERLMSSFCHAAGVFPHWPGRLRRMALRSHVACFADQVYPIEALAHYHAWCGNAEAATVAARCADQICALQGTDGQWWWHYDARSGRIIEGYPVYTVHQDAMAPIALFALQDACGGDYWPFIERGMRWLEQPAEVADSLIDEDAAVIWRKVARREPGKLSRGAQALASRVHPAWRVPGIGRMLPPTSVDYECRPYHLGWLLYAWANRGPSA